MRKTCLNEVYKLAKKDKRVLFFGSDIGTGTLEGFKEEFPDRFFMEGVNEAHIIGMMAGLAMNGKIPYFNTIATFLTRRCYEQIILDLCKHKLNVRLIGSGGGLVYAPLGTTHHSFQDIGLLRCVPNMTIVAPCDAEEMKRFMPQTLDYNGPIYIRMAKGGDPVVSLPEKEFKIGKGIVMREGNDCLIVTTGITLKLALEAADQLKEEGIKAAILHMHTVSPLDKETLLDLANQVRCIITVEEHILTGGLGSSVAETIAEANFSLVKKFKRIALPDVFPEQYGSQDSLMGFYGVTAANIVKTVNQQLVLEGEVRG